MFRLIVLFVSIFLGQNLAFDYEKCDSGKCFGLPIRCAVTKNCDIVAYFDKEGDKYRFDLMADHKDVDVTDKWVAVGLSLDGSMGDDAVVACYVDADMRGHVENFWNIDNPKYTLPVADAQGGLSDVSVTVTSGKLECSFLRDAVTDIVTPLDTEVTIDLNSIPYHVEIATGPHINGQLLEHIIMALTESPVNFSEL